MDVDQKAMDAMRKAGHQLGDLMSGQQNGQSSSNHNQQGLGQAQDKINNAQQQGSHAADQAKSTAKNGLNKASEAAQRQ